MEAFVVMRSDEVLVVALILAVYIPHLEQRSDEVDDSTGARIASLELDVRVESRDRQMLAWWSCEASACRSATHDVNVHRP